MMCIVQPVTLYIGDVEPEENQILMSSVIQIQFQKLFCAIFICQNLVEVVQKEMHERPEKKIFRTFNY